MLFCTALVPLAHILATGFFIGYLPASGTVATLLLGIPAVLLWHRYVPVLLRGFIGLALMTLVALIITHGALPCFEGIADPSAIVIDEVIGLLWTFWGRKVDRTNLLIGVVAFRFFDITKWGLVGASELLPGAIGIVVDDVVAGLFANLTIWGLRPWK